MLIVMRKTIVLFILFFMTCHMLFIVPSIASEDSEVVWEENIQITGSCAKENVRKHIQVNRTVVEIIVNLNWETNGTQANLDMWMEHSEGYVVNASSSLMMPEVMRVREFPNRGRWTFVVIPTSCGTSGEAFFTADINIRNIALPEFEVSENTIDEGDNVTLSMNSDYENVTAYFFEFGDDTDSGWIGQSSVSKEYEEEGKYAPQAKVRYSDGTESDWIEVGEIEVLGEDEVDLFLIAQMTIVILVIISVVIFVLIRRRKRN
jgi:hypothetical protein